MLALKQGDTFGVLAQAGEPRAVLRLGLALALGRRDQASSDPGHGSARQGRIDSRRDHEETWNGNGPAGDLDGHGAADGPEHHDEGRRREHRRCQSDRQLDRRLGRDPRVVGDAAFGIRVRAADEIELVAAAVAKPAIEQAMVEPGAPAPLNGHAQAELHDAHEHAARQQRQVKQRQRQNRTQLPALQGVENDAIPDVHAVGGGKGEKDDQQKGGAEQPRD